MRKKVFQRMVPLLLCVTLAAAGTLGACGKDTGTTPDSGSELTGKDTQNNTGDVEGVEQMDETVYKNFFEDGDMKGFVPRGSATLEISNAKNHTDSGTNSLYVTGRKALEDGAAVSVAKLVEAGKSYNFSAWALQESGKMQQISMKFQYEDKEGATQNDKIKANVNCMSGGWTRLSATCIVPEYQGDIQVYFEAPSSEDLSFYIDDVVIVGKEIEVKEEDKGFQKTDENYEAMKKAGVFSTGNNARIKKVIEKARAGEDVTLAYIGGSITSGGVASPNSNCYAQVSATKFAETYGKDDGSNVHFINAGMHGTPSDIGVVRYQRDVIARLPQGSSHPDILFIEFAVNDYQCETGGGAYEGLIREALDSGSAVVLVFSVFQTLNTVCEGDYHKFGEHYDLPMVSMGDAIKKYAKEDKFNDWYYGDSLHPNNQGHELMADCIMQLFDQIDQETAEADNIADVNAIAPVLTSAYQGIQMIEQTTQLGGAIISIDAGGFSERDSEVPNFGYPYKDGKDAPWFPDGWLHTTDSGSEPLKLKINCSTLMLVYKQNSQQAYGSADLYIDGEKKATLSCYDTSGWNNGKVYLAITEEEAKEHVVELKMAAGDEDKKFSLMAIGYK